MNEAKREAPPKKPWSLHTEMEMRSFPVAYIKANPNNDFVVPGKVGSSITTNADRPKNMRHHFVEFIPDLQAFAVWFYEINQEPKMEYVPASQVRSWAALR